MPAHRKEWRPIKEIEEEADFTARVAKAMEGAGYSLTHRPRFGNAPAFDFFALGPRRQRIAVECKARGFKDERDVMNWIAKAESVRPRFNSLWIVSDDISERLRRMTDAYQGVELWTFYEFQRHMNWERRKS